MCDNSYLETYAGFKKDAINLLKAISGTVFKAMMTQNPFNGTILGMPTIFNRACTWKG